MGLRVIFVADRFYPLIGGGEKYVLSIASGLAERGHDVHVLTSSVPGRPQLEVLRCGLKVLRIKPIFHVRDIPILPLLKFVSSDAEIIHISGPSLNEDVICPFLKALNHKVVSTYHADFIMENMLVTTYYVMKAHLTYRFVDKIIVTTVRYAEILKRRGVPSEKISVIPIGVNEEIFKPAKNEERVLLRERYGIKGKIVLFVGGFDRKHAYKHPEILLKSFKSLIEDKKFAEARLIMVGGGELIKYYQKFSEGLGISKRVSFLGRVSMDHLVNLYKMADIFVLPSPLPSEGFGMTALEAMASGCPVIVTRACGCSEIIRKEKSGIIVKPWSTSELKDAMATLLLDEDLRRKLAYNGRMAIEKIYNWKRIVDRVEQLYEGLVEESEDSACCS